MSSESPDNSFHWRNKLEGLEQVPGETFDKDAAWNKLHGRLRGKGGNKKIFWYWAAAACVLFVCMIAWMNYHKTGSKPSGIETAAKRPGKTNVPNSMADKNKKTENINTDRPVRDKIVTAIKTSGQIDHSTIHVEAVSNILLNDIHSETGPVIKPLQILDTPSTVSIVLTPKKQLNVVHINELGDPVVESAEITRNTDKHSFKFKLAKEEIFVNSSMAFKPTGFTIIKTRPSSN